MAVVATATVTITDDTQHRQGEGIVVSIIVRVAEAVATTLHGRDKGYDP